MYSALAKIATTGGITVLLLGVAFLSIELIILGSLIMLISLSRLIKWDKI